MKRINTCTPHEAVKYLAVKTLREYYEKTEQVECTDGFFSEFLYFMNGHDEGHSTNAIYYGGYCERSMKAFADPRISLLMAESMGDDYKRFVEMIFRLRSLMAKLEMFDHYEALIESYSIELYGFQEDLERMKNETERTELKIASLQARHPEKNI